MSQAGRRSGRPVLPDARFGAVSGSGDSLDQASSVRSRPAPLSAAPRSRSLLYRGEGHLQSHPLPIVDLNTHLAIETGLTWAHDWWKTSTRGWRDPCRSTFVFPWRRALTDSAPRL